MGLYKELLISEVLIKGNNKSTKIDAKSARTPSNLLGIDLNIA